MPNEGNLKPFKKGTSGNPKGKPKGAKSFKTIYRELMETSISQKNPLTGKPETMHMKDWIALRLATKAFNGDLKAYELLSKDLQETGVDDANKIIGFKFVPVEKPDGIQD